jgi:uncharacterized protein YqgC (DUF456 family)
MEVFIPWDAVSVRWGIREVGGAGVAIRGEVEGGCALGLYGLPNPLFTSR